jgi:xanthine dehydrogenase accessory factor
MRTDLLVRADRLRSARTPFVLATVVRAERPTSAKAGDRALVLADGTLEGFVGGTCAESTVRVQGLRLLGSGESTLLRITPDTDERPSTVEGLVTVGNPCLSGGTLEIFLEAMLPPVLVHVFGDAPVARALVAVGTAMGYDVRASTDPAAALAADTAAVVVASHGRDEDTVLAAALRAGVPYVAMVASRRRAAAVLSEVDVPGELRARVHSPAGLDIGARTPAEVAMSVLAELVATRPRQTALPMEMPAEAAGARAVPGADVEPRGREAVELAAPAGSEPRVREAVDPVCGMAVAVVPGALSVKVDGRAYWFCGSGCQRAFAADPAAYSGAA